MPVVLFWALGGLGVGSFFGFSMSDGFKRLMNVIIVLIVLVIAFKLWKSQ
ncbi:hypothetical protein [Vibrio sp. OPT18]|nr:hypothetical protein [Vibrio sp. OPT18]MBE8577946.1 hypothetical protein [Vibrio sp. OPT18]